jgi:DNA gyrase/topoisomerase IV subunit B
MFVLLLLVTFNHHHSGSCTYVFQHLEQLFGPMLFLCFREKNLISVWNNGQVIPVIKQKDKKMFVPTMIFGHLLTSSNYNDEEEKVTGGRNGYGAKLCNIFSTMFTVETAAKEYKRSFKQVISCVIAHMVCILCRVLSLF